jgi:hypothetical protein
VDLLVHPREPESRRRLPILDGVTFLAKSRQLAVVRGYEVCYRFFVTAKERSF